jgi:hypothetical protein
MIEQFNKIPEQSDLKPNLSLFQSRRMHLETFIEVCVIYLIKFHLFDRVF